MLHSGGFYLRMTACLTSRKANQLDRFDRYPPNCDVFLSNTPIHQQRKLNKDLYKVPLYLFSLAALIVSRCVSHQPAGCCSLLLMDRLMVSICYCFIESLCGLVMARSVCNQSHLLFSTLLPLFLSQIHSADSPFPFFFFFFFPSFKSLSLFLCWDNL